MKRKIIWHLTACLMALSLLLAACAPAPITQTTPTTTAKPTAPATVAPAPAATPTISPTTTSDKPKYGGVFKRGYNSDIIYFEDVVGLPYSAITAFMTNERLLVGDWAKGPAGGFGSNETDWTVPSDRMNLKTGQVTESWDIDLGPELSSVTWHIRKGMHWALNPNSEASRLVNGRELTADDVLFSLNQVATDKRAYIYRTLPELRAAKITQPDQWSVKIEIKTDTFYTALTRFGDYVEIVPPEVVKKYGTMTDWRNSVGTGPFMLTDFVSGGSATLDRNPNYWMKDPIGPGKGNQLPYLDSVKILIIKDLSTLYAALRTAKIDWFSGIDWETAASLKKTTPQLKSAPVSASSSNTSMSKFMSMRTDKAPFNDVRVRRALMMATDFETIKKDYVGGEAQIVTWPIVFNKEYAAAYLGLDDPAMPASVRELYTYNPEKAKALLKEAGYPNGLKTNIMFTNQPAVVDYYSIIKNMWAKVGVDLELKPLESGARSAVLTAKSYDQMFDGDSSNVASLYTMKMYTGEGNNFSNVNDPVVADYYPKVQRAAAALNFAEADRLHKELMKHLLDQAYAIPAVVSPTYTFWWSWIKNYRGEVNVGYQNRHFATWVWLDEALKKSMGY